MTWKAKGLLVAGGWGRACLVPPHQAWAGCRSSAHDTRFLRAPQAPLPVLGTSSVPGSREPVLLPLVCAPFSPVLVQPALIYASWLLGWHPQGCVLGGGSGRGRESGSPHLACQDGCWGGQEELGWAPDPHWDVVRSGRAARERGRLSWVSRARPSAELGRQAVLSPESFSVLQETAGSPVRGVPGEGERLRRGEERRKQDLEACALRGGHLHP